jgi:glycosyltransferase involved in cell wall biosynthesis
VNPVTFTVFTPTYNRAHTLTRVYSSLQTQTFRDFEWLVVDDGSTDGTAELIAAWRAEADFPVRYFAQTNSGKHVAFNRGVREARGTLFLPFDSDDACIPQALSRLDFHWNSIPPAQRAGFSAVSALCADQNGRLVGTRFPFDPTDSDPLEIRYRYRVRGDKWGFHRTEVLKEHPFPEPAGQTFVTESVLWGEIAQRYQTRYVNEVLYTYYLEDTPDSLTRTASHVRRVAPMFAQSNRVTLNRDLSWFTHSPLSFLKSAANYARYSLHAGQPISRQVQELDRAAARALYTLTLPLGWALYMRDLSRE